MNGDGTIRLISDEVMGKTPYSTIPSEKYGGYTYDNSAPNVGDGTSSTIKTYLENWYTTNLSEYDNLIANTRYCNDTTVSEVDKDGYIYYGANERVVSKKIPQFIYPNTTKTYGGEYDLKIGLLTVDELVFAGGSYRVTNTNYYLKNGNNYWLGTPSFFSSNGFATEFGIRDDGYCDQYNVVVNRNVVPVINLKSNILYSIGDGTKTNPYAVNLNNI